MQGISIESDLDHKNLWGVVIQDRFTYNRNRLHSRTCEESDIILS